MGNSPNEKWNYITFGNINLFFKGCETIIHIICTGSIFFICKSILESYVSMHEYKIEKQKGRKNIWRMGLPEANFILMIPLSQNVKI